MTNLVDIEKQSGDIASQIRLTVDILEARNRFATLKGTGEILRYLEDRGYWERDVEWYVRAESEKIQNREQKRSFKNEIVTHIQDNSWTSPQLFNIGTNAHEDKLCLVDGVLDLDTLDLKQFSPDYFFLNSLPYKLIRKPWKKPLFIESLETTIPDPIDRQLVLDYLATGLWSNTVIQRQLWLIGDGENGKDFIFSVYQALLTQENWAEISPHELEHNRFAPARLFGKKFCISADIGDEDLSKSSVLKSASGGSPLNCEKKGKDGFAFVYGGGFGFGGNHLPQTDDKSHGFMRRPIIIRMTETFYESEIPKGQKDNPHAHIKDPTLKSRCTRPEELSLLLTYLICRLRKIRRINRIPNAPSVEETKEMWESQVSYIPDFVKTACEMAQNQRISSAELYQAYVSYCEKTGHSAISQKMFPKSLTSSYPKIKHAEGVVKGSKKPRTIFIGITLKSEIAKTNKEQGQREIFQNDNTSVNSGQISYTSSYNFEDEKQYIMSEENAPNSLDLFSTFPFTISPDWIDGETLTAFFDGLVRYKARERPNLPFNCKICGAGHSDRMKAAACYLSHPPPLKVESGNSIGSDNNSTTYCRPCDTDYGKFYQEHIKMKHGGVSA